MIRRDLLGAERVEHIPSWRDLPQANGDALSAVQVPPGLPALAEMRAWALVRRKSR